jgi:hypothetical protein
MKKTNTSNPLKFFNDAKEARNKSFSKSLSKKGEGGRTMGPMTQQEAAAEVAATSYPGPYAIPSVKDQIIKGMGRPSFANPNDYRKDNTRRVNNIEYERESNSNSGAMQAKFKDLDNYKRQVGTQQQNLMEQERIKANTPSTNTPQPYIDPVTGRQMNMQKKGGSHKMPNGKVMLNSKMKKGGVMKSKKK